MQARAYLANLASRHGLLVFTDIVRNHSQRPLNPSGFFLEGGCSYYYFIIYQKKFWHCVVYFMRLVFICSEFSVFSFVLRSSQRDSL